MKSHEFNANVSHPKIEEEMGFSNDDNFRGSERNVTDFKDGKIEQAPYTLPQYDNLDDHAVAVANQTPNPRADMANIMNYRDHKEKVAIDGRLEVIGDPNILQPLARREKSQHESRLAVLEQYGDQEELHREFYEANKDKLHENAIAEAQNRGIEVRTPEVVRAEATEALASKFHDQWRETRLNEDGTYEPREKSTKDQAWIEAHGTEKVDIANTAFSELPADWQAENAAAAEVVVGIIDANNGNIDLEDDTAKNKAGEAVHAAWLSRNEWAKDGELGVPFEQLSAEEQDKDLAQVRTALELFSGNQE